MPKIDVKTKKLTIAVSVITAAALSIVGLLVFGVGALDDFVLFSVVLAIAPFVVLDYIDFKWRKGVDAQLPELFRSIVQTQETGMMFNQALEEAAKRDYVR